MCNCMTYSELKTLLQERHILIKGLAEELGMTTVGLQASMENESMKGCNIGKLCDFLNITPNDFFGYTTPEKQECTYNNIGVSATQTINPPAALAILEKQLKEKDKQIQELHKTIQTLTGLLNK